MKIAIEAQRIFREKKHGMDIATIELIRALQRTDLTNEYFILVKPGKDNDVLSETSNFHIEEIPSASYPVWEQVLLPRRVKKINPDILHCTSDTAPLQPGVPLVLTLHDIIFMKQLALTKDGSMYQRMGNAYRKWLVPKIIDKGEQIITVSNFEKEVITDYFPQVKNKLTTVYNSYSDQFRVVEDIEKLAYYKKKYNLPDYYLLFLGNTAPKKNIRNVLKALKLLNEFEQTKIPLVVPDLNVKYLKEILEEIDAVELLENIYLTGYVPNDELVYLYNLATLFVYPSLYESFGIPILESMACGTPVITSNKAAMPEVAGEAAELTDPENPEDIAFSIRKLICNEDIYEAYREAGLLRARSFSWSKSAQEVLSLYEQAYQGLKVINQ